MAKPSTVAWGNNLRNSLPFNPDFCELSNVFDFLFFREAISVVCEAVPGAKGAQRRRKVHAQ